MCFLDYPPVSSVPWHPASHKTDTGRVNIMVGYMFHPHDTSSYPIIWYIYIYYYYYLLLLLFLVLLFFIIYISTLSCYIMLYPIWITINHRQITVKSPLNHHEIAIWIPVLSPRRDPFKGEDIHVHFPAGGIPKAGSEIHEESTIIVVYFRLVNVSYNSPNMGPLCISYVYTVYVYIYMRIHIYIYIYIDKP